MAVYSGSCLCGSVTFQVQGEFERFYLCHCEYCRKDTGAAYAANLFSSVGKLIWLSGVDHVTSYNLPGTRHTKSFCRCCGSALPSDHGAIGFVVPAGSLDTKVSITPTAHLFSDNQAGWDNIETVPKFKGLPE